MKVIDRILSETVAKGYQLCTSRLIIIAESLSETLTETPQEYSSIEGGTEAPEEDSTIVFTVYGILRAPRKCGPGKVAVNGNCRTIYK